MDNRRSWHVLPATHPDVPPLLVSAIFEPASYSVYVSDLAHVWYESLGRKEICMRGFKENTPIDPSYDNEQMTVFLGKIRAAFEAPSPDRPDTRLALSPASGGGGDLVLQITSVLPQGLAPLKWPLYLKRCPPSFIAPELVVPLIQDRSRRLRETDLLLSGLKDKDTVISKLVGKLEAMGVGLESVFPSLAGRRKVGRTGVEDRVKGLAPFSEAHFRKQLNALDDEGGPWGVDRIVKYGIGTMSELKRDASLSTDGASDLEDWWVHLRSGAGTVLSPVLEDSVLEAKRAGSPPSEASVLPAREESFEKQPKMAPNPAKCKQSPGPFGRDEPSLPSSLASSGALPKRNAKSGIGRLGAIGKRGSSGQEASSSQGAKAAEDNVLQTSSSQSSVRAKPDTDIISPPESGSKSTPTDPVADNAEKDAGIGSQINSKRYASPAAHDEVDVPKAKPMKRGLGKIGKIGNPASAPQDTEKHSTPLPPGMKKETSAGREALGIDTKSGPSEDVTRADQPLSNSEAKAKRGEALQQTVVKHAAPVRKKRKF